jgi:TRAP transporter TAXI family solute receptor
MWNRRIATLSLLSVCAIGCRSESSRGVPPKTETTVRLLHTWGIDASATAQMQSALAASLSDMRVELNRADGSVSALRMLRRGDVDGIFTFASLAYMASTGELAELPEPSDNLRAIAELPSRPVQVVVGGRSGITSITALRGRHVSIGPTGTRAALVAELLLRAFGITLRDIRVERFEPTDGVPRVATGEVDAVFWSGPAHVEIDEAVRRGARILDISKEDLDRARVNYPLLKPTIIRTHAGSGLDRAIHTVGVDEIFLCRKDLDETIVHELTRALVELIAQRGLDLEPLTRMNLSLASSTAIPLHPGAARYYRERELLP